MENLSPHLLERDAYLMTAVDHVRSSLSGSFARVTGKHVACALEVDDAWYAGYNREIATNFMVHAERDATDKLPDGARVDRVYMGGRGQTKLKHVAPCGRCYNTLEPHIDEATEVVLLQPGTDVPRVRIGAEEFHGAYAALAYSELQSSTVAETIGELRDLTPLDATDATFVAKLRQLGLERSTQYYLTGSASGRNGIGSLLETAPQGYSDFKFVAVSERSRHQVEAEFGGLAASVYGDLGRVATKQVSWSMQSQREITYFANARKVISLGLGSTLLHAMARSDYVSKNFFHRIA